MSEHDFSPSGLIWTELEWLNHCLNLRGIESDTQDDRNNKIEKLYAAGKLNPKEKTVLQNTHSFRDLQPPATEGVNNDYYGYLVQTFKLNFSERFVLALALVPHFRPELLDRFLPVTSDGSRTTAIGGTISKGTFAGFLPTIQTALFLLGNESSTSYHEVVRIFDPAHHFITKNILVINPVPGGEPWFSTRLTVAQEIVDILLLGHERIPYFSSDFPARPLTTEMEWEDLVLSASTKRQIDEVKLWLRHSHRLMNDFGMQKRLKPGSKILFHGPPGTGKTLAASLLAKHINRPVLRVDLSMIVNKYIGETEKNLARLFDKAQNGDWILFFDEADSLFSNRTRVTTSNDRHANQEVSYLLQRIEEHPGIVLLATNMKGQIDAAFMRRFSSVVNFSFPKTEERLQLWSKAFPSRMNLTSDVVPERLAQKYELTGAQITNVIAWCGLKALEKGNETIDLQMVQEGIARELAKDGRTL